MAAKDERSRTNEVSLAQLESLIDSHYSFQILAAAVELDLFTTLDKEPELDRAAIAARLGLDDQPTRILLLGCTSLGLVRKEGDRYRCADATRQMLSKQNPWNLCAMVRFNNHVTYRAMASFCDALRRHTNVGVEAIPGQGTTLYERLAAHPTLEQTFHEMMSSVTSNVVQRFVEVADLSKLSSIIDIGGGMGINAQALATHWQDLRVTIFDLPSVCAAARARLQTTPIAARINVHPGDCFRDEFPSGADGILFAHFLEIWSEEQSTRLLERAYRALGPGGQIFLVNMFQRDDGTGPATAASFSTYFLTLASGGGMVYAPQDYERWLVAAGFRPTGRKQLGRFHALVHGVKD